MSNGDNASENGSKESPYKTIEAVLKDIKNNVSQGKEKYFIYLGDGQYTLNNTLEINGSEFNNADIVFKNMEGANPEISTLVKLNKPETCTINGINAWGIAMPKTSDNKMLSSRHIYTSDGKKVDVPKIPETGFYHVTSVPGVSNLKDADMWTGVSSMNYENAEISDIQNVEDVKVRAFHYWEDESIPIKSINTVSKVIAFDTKSAFCLNNMEYVGGTPYYLENVKEALNSHGEFYDERSTGKLYYVPYEGQDITSTVLYAAQDKKIININNYQGSRLLFEGIKFTGTDSSDAKRDGEQAGEDLGGAIEIDKSINVTFNCCTFDKIGTTAIRLESAVNSTKIYKCMFNELGGGAVNINGENVEESSKEDGIHDISITNCKVNGYGKMYTSAAAILLKYAYNCDILNNEIKEGGYTGVSVGWTWGDDYQLTSDIKISNNYIHDIGQNLLSDMGGIYTLGKQDGTVIENNCIHDVRSLSYCGNGIYLDEGSENIIVRKNLCYDVDSYGVFINYGQNNTVTQNILALAGAGAVGFGGRNEQYGENSKYMVLSNNILAVDGAAIYGRRTYELMLEDSNNLVWNYGGEIFNGLLDYSYEQDKCVQGEFELQSAETMKGAGFYKGTVISDPLFTDLQKKDFTLKAESPALKLGIESIDLSKIGCVE